MQQQIVKWTMLLLGGLLLCLVVWGAWRLLSSGSANQGETELNDVQLPIEDQPYVPAGGPQPALSTPGVTNSTDITGAFASLFSQVLATKVSFDPVDASSGGDKASVYALYAKDVSISKEMYPREISYPLHLALIDLNDDGASEAIVYEDLPGFCGVVGCPFDIYEKKSGVWNKIFSSVVQGEVGLMNVYVSGYRSLLLTLTGREGESAVSYTWDGKTYQPGEVVATWNGAGFVLNQ